MLIKIPVLMQDLGLHNIGVRINDGVKFINPKENKEDYIKQLKAMTKACGWDKQLSELEKENYINVLMEKGLEQREAEIYVQGESKITEYLMGNKDNTYIIQAPCTLISYGTK